MGNVRCSSIRVRVQVRFAKIALQPLAEILPKAKIVIPSAAEGPAFSDGLSAARSRIPVLPESIPTVVKADISSTQGGPPTR